MFRLDYLSCVLTILSTVLVGRRRWHGWVVAGGNSLVICYIGYRTAQTGFIPANLFCLAIYGYNVWQWRHESEPKKPGEQVAEQQSAVAMAIDAEAAHGPRRVARPRHVPGNHERPARRHSVERSAVEVRNRNGRGAGNAWTRRHQLEAAEDSALGAPGSLAPWRCD